MNEPERPTADQQLDAYLDGQLDEAARDAFERRLRDDKGLAHQAELQASLDQSLQRQFPNVALSEENLQAITASLATRSPDTAETVRAPYAVPFARRRTLSLAAVAVAAAVGWVAVTAFFSSDSTKTPFFAASPLVQLYQETVDNGFQPYYECREDERFAATFLRRQGQPLRLLAMPEGSSMLGISYPGGLSRDTTAMLCHVDGQPVMVFVDRLESDVPTADDNDVPNLHIFRQEKHGLVFYEVTPFDTPRMTDQFGLPVVD